LVKNETAEATCKATHAEAHLLVAPIGDCAGTTKPPEPTGTTKPPEPTGTPVAECSTIDKCSCYKYEKCGLCLFSNSADFKCLYKVDPTNATNMGYGELKCKNAGGVSWTSGEKAMCPAHTTTKPVEPSSTKPWEPNPQDCYSFSSDLCACVKSEFCGACLLTYRKESTNETFSYKKCLNKQYSTEKTAEQFCLESKGIYRVGVNQPECNAGEHHEAEVKGTITGTIDEAVKTAIEQVVQKIIADKLGVDVTKVVVTVDVTTNADSTSSFKVTVKVGNTEVSSDKFEDISKISTSDLEAQLAAQGVTLSGSVNISNNSNFAGKLLASLIGVAFSMLFIYFDLVK